MNTWGSIVDVDWNGTWHFVWIVYVEGNVGSVVECSPATRAARVRFPDVASFAHTKKSK